MTEADEDDWDDSKEEAWCLSIRPKVIDFLTCQHVTHGQVGELPAWHVVPYVSVWAIESAKAPGWVGWWVICGDLPTSICSAHECRHPRLAVRRFAETWKQALAETLPDARTIGTLRIPAKFASLLAARSELLIEFANNDGLWPDELYG